MSYVRDVRTPASEVKFLVNPQVGERVREWARAHLEPDPYGTGPFADEYETTSLYFDTAQYDVFHRRGSFGRAKYRIRRYGWGDAVFLERKLRRPNVLVKRRTKVPLDNLGQLNGSSDGRAWDGEWFDRRLNARELAPVCQLSYRRMARGLTTGSGAVRLTLDGSIRAASIDAVGFTRDEGAPVLADALVLELKFRHPMPAVFKQVVEHFKLTPQSTSKYRLGMSELKGWSMCGAR